MPIQKASFKSMRKSAKNFLRNNVGRENISYVLKQARKALAKKDEPRAQEFIKKFIRAIDRAAQKGIVKKNTAARKKSRLIKKLRETFAKK